MYLLDTDHCVFLLRRMEPVCRRFEAYAEERAFVSIMTVAELLFGACWSSRPEENLAQVNGFVDTLTILPFSRSIADRFGRIKTELFRKGQKIEDPDLIIAATALEYDLTLLTHNTAHYDRIDGLRLNDWAV